jgi:hypothetical protein
VGIGLASPVVQAIFRDLSVKITGDFWDKGIGRGGIGRLKFKDTADDFIPFLKFPQVAENWLVPEQAEHVPQYILGQRAVIGRRIDLAFGVGFDIGNDTTDSEVRRFGLNRAGNMGERTVVEHPAIYHAGFLGIETAQAVFPQMRIGEFISRLRRRARLCFEKFLADFLVRDLRKGERKPGCCPGTIGEVEIGHPVCVRIVGAHAVSHHMGMGPFVQIRRMIATAYRQVAGLTVQVCPGQKRIERAATRSACSPTSGAATLQ